MDKIINLPMVKGTNYVNIQEFYEEVRKNHDTLLTLGEADMLWGFVITTLIKLLPVKLDLVCTDEKLARLEHGDIHQWLEEVAEKKQDRRVPWRMINSRSLRSSRKT